MPSPTQAIATTSLIHGSAIALDTLRARTLCCPPTMHTPLSPTAPIELHTHRLWLRRWRDEDRAPFAALNADAEVMRWFPSTQSREASDASIDFWLAQFAAQGWSNWAVRLCDGAGDAAFVGFVGLSVPRRVLPCSPCVEIGWRLARAHWSRGYASEAAEAALQVAFERLQLPEIVSFTALGNQRSRAVMQRIGLHDTGEDFDHPALPAGHPLQRHCLYRITRAQWQARRAARAAAGPAPGATG